MVLQQVGTYVKSTIFELQKCKNLIEYVIKARTIQKSVSKGNLQNYIKI